MPSSVVLEVPLVLASLELQACPAGCAVASPPAETAAEYWVTMVLEPAGPLGLAG